MATNCCSSSSVPRICGTFHLQNSTNRTKISYPLTTISFSSSSFYGSSTSSNKIQLRTHAKFEKFQSEEGEETSQVSTVEEIQQDEEADIQEEDDSCLPSDLVGAVRQSSVAAAEFVSVGGARAIVELLIPQLEFLDEEGAQAELWELSRIFVDTLIEETGCQKVKAVYPDAGAAALLKYQWKDAAFGFASLSDRKPVDKDDEIVVMVVPDYQMLEYVEKIAANISDDPDIDEPRPLIMWNPRLYSADVGVGFNVRKLRRYFLSTFTTVYSMRPLPNGAVFRCYPESWKVFYDDKDRPNRYLLAKEQISRPDSEDLEIIFGEVEEKSEKGPSLFGQAASIFSSMSRFMRVISK
ncbi:hypothetical protein MKX03_021494 [Papaver bracteatum]|nr:hypothetical protein MKX03_021494 [Papaver bracteatum]